MTAPVALIVGAGGVLGGALCEEFANAGHAVVGLRRARAEAPRGVEILACDLWNPVGTARIARDVLTKHGHVDVLICNAAHFVTGAFTDIAYPEFEAAWCVAVGSAIGALHAVLPAMVAREAGTVLVTGATASLRGSAQFSALAAAKAGLRGLTQSLAREYQPRGVHVAHVVVDGLLRGSPSVARFGGRDHRTIDPRALARLYRELAAQPADAWTHEIDVRPRGERF
jgi:NAD(P)-dependent dehydrogenase (short-subunit alcohol dehydrogenase family)